MSRLRRVPADELDAVYREVDAEAHERGTGQAPRVIDPRAATSALACVSESLGPSTQRITGVPWILPSGTLSPKGRVLDEHLLGRVGFKADPAAHGRPLAYLTDVCHLWLGRTPSRKLRRPRQADVDHCTPWLERELRSVGPRVILLLGEHASRHFLRRFTTHSGNGPMESLISQRIPCNVGGMAATAIPTWHPTRAQCRAGGPRLAYASTVVALRTELAGG